MADVSYEPPKTAEAAFRSALDQGLFGSDDAFRQHVEKRSDLWEMRDEDGLCILHHAIKRRGDPNRIEILVGRRPDLASMRMGRSHNGQLPLNMTLDEKGWHKDAEVAHLLLEKFPLAARERDDIGTVSGWPLHKVLQKTPFNNGHANLVFKLIRIWPQAIYQPVHGDLPLHRAMDGSKPENIVTGLLNYHLGAAAQPNSEGILPLHLAVHHQMAKEILRRLVEAYPPAMIAPVNLPGPNSASNILEYALKNKTPPDVLALLMTGGETAEGYPLKPRYLAMARANIFGMQSKPWVKIPDVVDEKDKHKVKRDQEELVLTMHKQQPVRFVVRFNDEEDDRQEILPGHSIVSDLKQRLFERDHVPVENQKLILLTGDRKRGRRLMDGEQLLRYIKHAKERMHGGPLDDEQEDEIATLEARREEEPKRKRMQPIIKVESVNTLLHSALRKNIKKEAILQLLRIRPEFAREEDHQGMLPLHVALTPKHFDDQKGEIVKELLEAFPESRTMLSGKTTREYPLQSAICCHKTAEEGSIAEHITRRLLRDVQPTDWDEKGQYSPSIQPQDDFFREHVSHEVPLLHLAIANKCSHHVIFDILDKGYPVQVRNPRDGYSVLEYSLIYNSGDPVFEHILNYTSKKQSLIFQMDKGPNGQTFIHLACRHNVAVDRLRKLCDFGEHFLQTRDMDGRLPIHIAVTSGASFDGVRELISRFPESVHDEDSRGRTPLMLAVVSNPSPGVVLELARNVRDIGSVVDARGRSLLHMAVLADAEPTVVEELLTANPGLLSGVNLIDGQWPVNKAGTEVRRLALLPKMNLKSPSMRYGAGTPMAHSMRSRGLDGDTPAMLAATPGGTTLGGGYTPGGAYTPGGGYNSPRDEATPDFALLAEEHSACYGCSIA